MAEDHLARISLCTSATMPRGECMLPFSRDYTIYLSILNSLSQSFPKLVSINFVEEIKTDIIFRLVDKFYSHYLAIITISKLVSTFSRVILKKKLDRIFVRKRIVLKKLKCNVIRLRFWLSLRTRIKRPELFSKMSP